MLGGHLDKLTSALANTTLEGTSKSESGKVPVARQQIITPWDVQGEVTEDGHQKEVDYQKYTVEFGAEPINAALLERFKRLTGHKPHPLLRRGTFFCHRDFNLILDCYEKGEPFYLYTGRGPSSNSIHLGHMIPFMFTKWLQDVFDVPLVIQLTDDEEFLVKQDLNVEDAYKDAFQNAKDIIAVGFNLEKTFIFSDLDYVGGAFYKNILKVSKLISYNQAKGAFGFDDSTNIGKVHFASVQAAPSFSNSFPQIFGTDSSVPCLIPCGVDQDPYFRLTRDVAAKLNYPKPALLEASFIPGLGKSSKGKMSASKPDSSIYMKDSPKEIKDKITRHAFSGGQATEEEHRRLGGNPDVDVSYKYLSFFLEDDAELQTIYVEYKSGKLLTGQLKARCISVVQDIVGRFQERRANITDEKVKAFMDPTRKIDIQVLQRKRAQSPLGS